MRQSDTIFDVSFPHSYECRSLAEIPVNHPLHYFYPGASTKEGRDGLLVEICPERGQCWVGTFAFGQLTPDGVSCILTTPDSQRVCVVSKGYGYLVHTTTPTLWERVPCIPIIDVRPIVAQRIIVFANFTELLAYGETGIKWRTSRLSWDSLKITQVTDTFIKGEFWDIRTEAIAEFVVDLVTGTHEGGIEE